MKLVPRERKEVDLHFRDEETGIHVKVQEMTPSFTSGKKPYFAVSVHIDHDTHYNSLDLACEKEDDARYLAETTYEFFKKILPILSIKKKEGYDEHDCMY